MTDRNKRHEERTSPTLRTSPVSCRLCVGGTTVPLEIVNYHYRGACFRISVNDYRVQEKDTHLQFQVGHKNLQEKILYRIVWETISENGLFGVEFEVESAFVLARAERFMAHGINTPVVSAKDPLDPNRALYFKTVNISATGMLLGTSLSNKHLFPGMEVRGAMLEIPNMGKTKIDFFIENSRPAEGENTILYGVSVKNITSGYQDLTARYLSNLGMVTDSSERIDKLVASGFIQKDLRHHLTIREVQTQRDYDEVLKLRYVGYLRAGKTKQGVTWQDMGEGLGQEGLILAAFLGGQAVASVELRFSNKSSMRLAEKVSFDSVPSLKDKDFVEINRLVVHPTAQKTDIVVGLFQKIHTLAMLNGKPHGLLMAEDKLVALYLRLGAQKIGLSFEHPTKLETRLHVMVIPRETYEDADGINPLAWSHVYETTHSFLNELGLSEERHLSPLEKVHLQVSKIAMALQARRKKKTSPREKAGPKKTGPSDAPVVEPKWTKQHLHASVLLPYLLVSDDLIGKDRTNQILVKYGFHRNYFSSASNWISIAFFDEFVEEFKQRGNVDELQKLAGYRNLSKEVLGVNHFLLKHFLTLNEAFKALGSHLAKFNKTRTCNVIESGHNFCRLRIGLLDRSLKPKDASAQLNWQAILDAHVLTMTGRHGEVEQVKSIFTGDDYCEYVIRWKASALTVRKLLSLGLMVGAVSALFHFARQQLSLTESLLLSGGLSGTIVLGLLYRAYLSAQKKYVGVTDSLSTFQKDAEERYKELQNSKAILEKGYQEGRVLEEISREIQTTDDLSRILNTGLRATCEKFEFSRAFIMIVDSERKYLRTSALLGAGESADEIWNFKVDVSVKRDNPMVLSSVYHSGQSILIANIADHVFHLNESSRRLIDRLQSRGFAMVPIPSEKGNWGVMVADKGQSDEIITRRDLVAIQRICQSLGLALDKKAKIEEEIRVRRIFQKYVPSTVIESTLGSMEPRLGGESRETICFFMDIRSFTRLSHQLPPQILVGVLNQIFEMLQTAVKETNGVIDKFLGDGALVTWGAVPGSEPDPALALKTARTFLTALHSWNEARRAQGIPEIQVGIGIHKGPAISGNVGSQDRMEYTVIGQTVNMASRLEQLTKVYSGEVVISESLMDFSALGPDWEIKEGVQVRGVDRPLRIAVMNTHQQTTTTGGALDEAG
ncbi:MAG: GAF domain-containing protein [Bdellovibrionaceae bacterium]|nr:GAF domain-containing protein [Pseudobdellovibrionaceae bacterium]